MRTLEEGTETTCVDNYKNYFWIQTKTETWYSMLKPLAGSAARLVVKRTSLLCQVSFLLGGVAATTLQRQAQTLSCNIFCGGFTFQAQLAAFQLSGAIHRLPG